MEEHSQGIKRKSADNLSDASSSKKQQIAQEDVIIKSFNETIFDENSEDSNEQNSEVEDGENLEYSEVEDCDEYSNDESEDLQKGDSGSDDMQDTSVCDIIIPDDNYLSFSDNEITDERIVESRQNPSQSAGANKNKKKVKRKRKKKDPNTRRNIRNVLTDKQLDSTTQILREKELDRLKKLGMISSTPVITPTPSAAKSTVKPGKVGKKPIPQNTVICLMSSDEEEKEKEPEKEKHQRDNSSSSLLPSLITKKKEVLVLSSDSDEQELNEEEKLAEHHSDLGLCYSYYLTF